MRIIEFRIPLPLSVEEYQRGQLYMIAKYSRENSGKGGEWIDIRVNEPFEDERGKGQFTHKVIHLDSRIPYWLACVMPSSALEIHEKAWNAYPYSKTEYSCVLGDRFQMTIETRYVVGGIDQENVLNLTPEELAVREVDIINIRDDTVPPEKYKEEEDPSKFHSEKTGRGPLQTDWLATSQPLMCCYKVCRFNVSWWGIQTRVEELIRSGLRDLMVHGHQQVFCWLDQWYDMSMTDIRAYEEETKRIIAELIEQEAAKKAAEAAAAAAAQQQPPQQQQKSGWFW